MRDTAYLDGNKFKYELNFKKKEENKFRSSSPMSRRSSVASVFSFDSEFRKARFAEPKAPTNDIFGSEEDFRELIKEIKSLKNVNYRHAGLRVK